MAKKHIKVKKNSKNNDLILNNYIFPIFFAVLLIVLVIFIFLNFNTILLFIEKLNNVLMPIILGLVLSYVLSPLYNILVDSFNKYSRIIATIICVLVIIFVIAGLIALVIPQLYQSILTFKNDFLGDEEKINLILNNISLIPIVGSSLSIFFNDMLSNLSEAIMTTIMPNINQIATTVYTGAFATFKLVINFLIGVIVMVYVINMKDELIFSFKKMFYAILDKKYADKLMVELRFTHQTFSGFIVGKLLDSIIIGILCYFGCLILRIPYAVLVSVIIGVTNVIPFFGPFIGAVPSFIFIVVVNPFKGIIFLLFILVLQQFDGNFLGPKILSDKTGVKSFYVLFSIVLFGGLFGFVGMVISVPLWAVLSRLCWQFLDQKLINKHMPTNINAYKDK